MPESNSVKSKCQNPACGRYYIMRLPVKPGKYAVNCPHCRAVNYFSLKSTPAPAETMPCTDAKARPEIKPGNNRQEEPCKKTATTSAAEPLPGSATRPQSEPEPPERHESRESAGTSVSSTTDTLEMATGSWWNKKTYRLHQGTHYIGRMSDTVRSDFMIKDNTMSYRSVEITVSHPDSGFVTMMKVLDALNPVYLNNREIKEGESAVITRGDHLILGSTLFILQ